MPVCRIVFIGPCIAKKAEIKDPFVQGTVDAVLTYEELLSLFAAAGISPGAEEPRRFDGPRAYLGRSIPISGGLLRAAGIDADILQNSVLVTEGKDRVLPVFRELAEGKSRARVLDVLFCEGCINGPKMTNTLSVFARKEMLTDHINERNGSMAGRGHARSRSASSTRVDLARDFRDEAVVLPQPTEAEIAVALQKMRKFGPEDQLNCGSCGYPSCRDKAVAVCQGLAEVSMCLPYLVEELEGTLSILQRSHQATQDKLVQTERLASMGQISAGVAHEINNPLSTILLYSHMLLKAHREGDPESEDIQMIVSEANRCRTIMRGLLDFARQSRVVKTPTDLGRLVRDLVDAMNLKLDAVRCAACCCDAAAGLPLLMLDADQVRQMLVNLVQNGIDAVEETAAGPDGSGRRESSEHASRQRGTRCILRVQRYRAWHAARGRQGNLHALLHDEAAGQGHRDGLVHRLRRGENARRGHLGGQRGRDRAHRSSCEFPSRRSQGGNAMSTARTVLLVDDDADFVEMNRMLLEQNGYAVRVAYSGRQCLAEVAACRPDIIILDMVMESREDGFDVSRELRNSEHTKSIPLVMITSVNDSIPFRLEPDRTWLPVDALLEKPVEPQLLLTVVDKALQTDRGRT